MATPAKSGPMAGYTGNGSSPDTLASSQIRRHPAILLSGRGCRNSDLVGRSGVEEGKILGPHQRCQCAIQSRPASYRSETSHDEAHHCYRAKPGNSTSENDGALDREEKEEAKKNNEAARLWISGLEALQRSIGTSTVYDLSATPFFLRGSGYLEGTLFHWTVSDFSLMDAIECGIVKLPRVPVADNVVNGDTPIFRNLWEEIKKSPRGLPKKWRNASNGTYSPLDLPPVLLTALEALYGRYKNTFDLWQEAGIGVPPVFIVVCNNTSTSELIYKYVSGFIRQNTDGSETPEYGRLELFRNHDENFNHLPKPNTILIDSVSSNLATRSTRISGSWQPTRSSVSDKNWWSGRAIYTRVRKSTRPHFFAK
nr:hypothetical protein [Rhodomicrobium udaipurense]